MDNYSITLPNIRAGSFRLVTLIVLLLNIFAFTFIVVQAGVANNGKYPLAGLVISLTSLIFFVLSNYYGYKNSYRVAITFILNAILWILMGKILVAILLIVFAIMGFFANRPLRILFSKKGIDYPSFPRKMIQWSEVAQVILKDDVLTIDLKNNTLIQVVISRKDNDTLLQADFNAFCKARDAA